MDLIETSNHSTLPVDHVVFLAFFRRDCHVAYASSGVYFRRTGCNPKVHPAHEATVRMRWETTISMFCNRLLNLLSDTRERLGTSRNTGILSKDRKIMNRFRG